MEKLADARFVIIGGGAVGCGVAYALAKAGHTDILLLERAEKLASITTSQGAGLCGQVRTTADRTQLAMHSAQTFAELQRDAPVKPEWHAVGSLRIALSDRAARMFESLHANAQQAGLDAEFIDNATAARRWPAINLSAARSILWCPTDGYMRPQSVVAAYEYQCRERGVRFATSTPVESVELSDGRVAAVRTSRGTVNCQYVINAAGAHAYHIARLVGLEFPIVPVRHEYFVSVALPGLSPDLPCFRIPDLSLYGRADGEALLLGGWEGTSLDTDPRGYELAGAPPTIELDWPVLDDFESRFAPLFPAALGSQKTRIGRGWPTFTPDGHFILGQSSRVPGFVMAGGCNAHGISGSPGIGKLLVESLFAEKPSDYVRSLSPDRYNDVRWDWNTARKEARQVYETYYTIESC